MIKAYKITVFAENAVIALVRITNILAYRKINIESLQLVQTRHKGISRLTIVTISDQAALEKVKQCIEHIVEVLQASLHDADQDGAEEF